MRIESSFLSDVHRTLLFAQKGPSGQAAEGRRSASSPGSDGGATDVARPSQSDGGSNVHTQDSRPVRSSTIQLQISRRRLGERPRAVCGTAAESGATRAVGKPARPARNLKTFE